MTSTKSNFSTAHMNETIQKGMALLQEAQEKGLPFAVLICEDDPPGQKGFAQVQGAIYSPPGPLKHMTKSLMTEIGVPKEEARDILEAGSILKSLTEANGPDAANALSSLLEGIFGGLKDKEATNTAAPASERTEKATAGRNDTCQLDTKYPGLTDEEIVKYVECKALIADDEIDSGKDCPCPACRSRHEIVRCLDEKMAKARAAKS